MRLTRRLLDVRPLRTSSQFRGLWLGRTLSMVGGQIALVAVLYQVWTLTHSATAVGAIGLAKAVPMVVLGLVGGSLADAVDRRKLVLGTLVGHTVTSALLAAQAIAGVESLWLVLALIAAQTSCGALGAPAFRTFVSRLLPPELVPAGVALFHTSFQLSMLVGPAIAGVLAAQWGPGVCYAVNAITIVVALYAVARIPPMRPLGEGTSVGLRGIAEGWRFIARQPVLLGVLLTDAIATLLAMPVSVFPVINAEKFGDRPETLGLFLSAMAVGGILTSGLSGAVTRSSRPGAVMLASAAIWGVALAGVGVVGSVWLALGCLVIAGAADTASVISRGSILQLATPDSYRGRVSAAEHVIGVTGPDLGNYRGGLVADLTSGWFSLVSGGVLCFAGVMAVAATNRSLRRFSSQPDRDSRPATQPTGQPTD